MIMSLRYLTAQAETADVYSITAEAIDTVSVTDAEVADVDDDYWTTDKLYSAETTSIPTLYVTAEEVSTKEVTIDGIVYDIEDVIASIPEALLEDNDISSMTDEELESFLLINEIVVEEQDDAVEDCVEEVVDESECEVTVFDCLDMSDNDIITWCVDDMYSSKDSCHHGGRDGRHRDFSRDDDCGERTDEQYSHRTESDYGCHSGGVHHASIPEVTVVEATQACQVII